MQKILIPLRVDGVLATAVDTYGQPQSAMQTITRGMQAELVLMLFGTDGNRYTADDLPYASFEFVLAHDWNSQTPPQLHVSEGITVDAEGLLHIPLLETNTEELVSILSGNESVNLGCELAGFQAGNPKAVFVLQWNLIVRNRRHDAGMGLPTPVQPNDYYSAAQIDALLAGKADAIDIIVYGAGDGIDVTDGVISLKTTGATTGQILKKTESGVAWQDETTGDALPTLTEGDNGKILTVVDNAWGKAESPISATTGAVQTALSIDTTNGDVGKVLSQKGTFVDLPSVENELPAVTTEDNGKVLTVVSGAWNKADAPSGGTAYTEGLGIDITNGAIGIDTTGANVGQVLKKTADGLAWSDDNAGSGGGVLPVVSTADNDKVLTVVNGSWAKADAPISATTANVHAALGIDTAAGNAGKVLNQKGVFVDLPVIGGSPPADAPEVIGWLVDNTAYPAKGKIAEWVEIWNLHLNDWGDSTIWRKFDIPAISTGDYTTPAVSNVWLPGRSANDVITAWASGHPGVGDNPVALVRLDEESAKDMAFELCWSLMPCTFPSKTGTGTPIEGEYVSAPSYLWRELEIEAWANGSNGHAPPTIRRVRTLYEASEYFAGDDDYLALADYYKDRWVLVRPFIMYPPDPDDIDELWPSTYVGSLPRLAYGQPTYHTVSSYIRGFILPSFRNLDNIQPYDPTGIDWRYKDPVYQHYLRDISVSVTEISEYERYITTKITSQQSAWTNQDGFVDYTPAVRVMACATYNLPDHPWVRVYSRGDGICPPNWSSNLAGALDALCAWLGELFEHRWMTYITGSVSVPVPENATGVEVSYLTSNSVTGENPSTIDFDNNQAQIKYTKVIYASTVDDDYDSDQISYVDEAGNAVDIASAKYCHISTCGIPGGVTWVSYRWYNGMTPGKPGHIKISSPRVDGYAPAPPAVDIVGTGESSSSSSGESSSSEGGGSGYQVSNAGMATVNGLYADNGTTHNGQPVYVYVNGSTTYYLFYQENAGGMQAWTIDDTLEDYNGVDAFGGYYHCATITGQWDNSNSMSPGSTPMPTVTAS